MRKLVAAIACRNKGSRLYGKPLQNLDIDRGFSVLDNIIGCLKQIPVIDEIVLGIANGIENDVNIFFLLCLLLHINENHSKHSFFHFIISLIESFSLMVG